MIKAGPTAKPMPKNQVRVGFVNLVPNQRPGDTIGKTIVMKRPKS